MIRVPERVRPCVPCMSRVCPGSPQASKLLFACLRKGQLNRHTRIKVPKSLLEKGSVESTHKVPTSHYHTKHCHAAVVSLDGLTQPACERVS